MITLEQQLCTDAFIAYCYQGGKYNPQDLFKPIVLKEIATLSRKYFKVSDIANEVKKSLGKKVPNILITKELSKLVADGTISYDKEHQTYVTEEDLSEIKDKHNYALNETTYFLQILRDYIKEHSLEYTNITVEDVMDYFESYCMSNLVEIIKFLGGIYTKKLKEIDKDCLQGLISNFIDIKVKTDERLKNTFENIFNGFHLRKIQEICADKINSQVQTIGNKIVYLDTNIIVRILGYQSDELNILGEDLLKLLHEYNYEIKVFKETIDELTFLLRGYQINFSKLVEGKKINHIYQTLKDKKIQPYEIPDIIAEIPNKLFSIGITVVQDDNFIPYDIFNFEKNVSELAKKKYQKDNEEEIEEFENIDGYNKYSKSAKHDLLCIEKIKKLRRDAIIARFEDAKYYFITADQTLIGFNKHYSSAHISESISDYSISFLLYFYKPDTLKGVSLHSFIASNYNNENLSISNWMNYVKIIIEQYNSGKLNENQFGYLMTDKIISNEMFVNNTIDEIINNNLIEYESMSGKVQTLERNLDLEKKQNQHNKEIAMKTENLMKIQKEKDDKQILYLQQNNNEMIQKINYLEESNSLNQKKINVLNDDNRQLNFQVQKKNNENLNLENRVDSLEKTLNIFMHTVFIILIAIGIIVFCAISKLFGSIVSTISLILEIIAFIDSCSHHKIIKYFIKK